MKNNKYTTIILVILSAILLSMFLYLVIETANLFNTEPEVKEETQKSLERDNIAIRNIFSKNTVAVKEAITPKTEVKYLLGEKKECEDKGGKFYVISNISLLTDNKYDYWLSCDKRYKEGNKSITETIFDYKI